MHREIDIRSLPVGDVGALQKLFHRLLVPATSGQACEIVRRLVGDVPTYGALHTQTSDAIEIETNRCAIGVPVSAFRELHGLLAKVTPWTPVCDVCGEYPLSNSGGKVSELDDGAACPFCGTGHVRTPVTLLRRLNWVTEELIDPSIVDDHRSISGARIPIVDKTILDWVRPDGKVHEQCKAFGLPLYGLLAYVNLRLRLLKKVEDAHGFLRDPTSMLDGRSLDEVIAQAKRSLLEREVWTIPSDTYHYDGRRLKDLPVITLGRERLFILDKIGQGFKCDVYLCRTDSPTPELVIAKVLSVPEEADLLQREFWNLKYLTQSNARGTQLFRKSVPMHVRYGAALCPDGVTRYVLAFCYHHGFDWTLRDVIREYPDGVDGRTMVWLGKRMFLVASWVHDSGLTHRASVPEHWLIHPIDHVVFLRDFAYASAEHLPIQTDMKHLPGLVDFWPAKSFANVPWTHQFDSAMICRCLIAVLGGDPFDGKMPSDVLAGLRDFLVENALYGATMTHARTAMELHDELSRIAKETYGDRKYVVLQMPNTTGCRRQEVL